MQIINSNIINQTLKNIDNTDDVIIINYNSHIKLMLSSDISLSETGFYYLAIDDDFDHVTDPIYTQFENISVVDDNLEIIFDTDKDSIKEWLGNTALKDTFLCIWHTEGTEGTANTDNLIIHSPIKIQNTPN